MDGPADELASRTDVGLGGRPKGLGPLGWRRFARQQLDFNKAVGAASANLSGRVRRLRRRFDALEREVRLLRTTDHENGAAAVRAQLYDLEGALRRDLSALQIEVARVAGRTPEDPGAEPRS